jgi:hypothetical protein
MYEAFFMNMSRPEISCHTKQLKLWKHKKYKKQDVVNEITV